MRAASTPGSSRSMSDLAAPLDRYRDVVRPEWIDHNQHMNVGYYLVVFDFATDEFMAWVGLDAAHRASRAVTTFCLEAHVTYHREVRPAPPPAGRRGGRRNPGRPGPRPGAPTPRCRPRRRPAARSASPTSPP